MLNTMLIFGGKMKKQKKTKLYKFYMKCYDISKHDEDLGLGAVVSLLRSLSEIKSNKRIKQHNIVKGEVGKFNLAPFINKRTGKILYYKSVK